MTDETVSDLRTARRRRMRNDASRREGNARSRMA